MSTGEISMGIAGPFLEIPNQTETDSFYGRFHRLQCQSLYSTAVVHVKLFLQVSFFFLHCGVVYIKTTQRYFSQQLWFS